METKTAKALLLLTLLILSFVCADGRGKGKGKERGSKNRLAGLEKGGKGLAKNVFEAGLWGFSLSSFGFLFEWAFSEDSDMPMYLVLGTSFVLILSFVIGIVILSARFCCHRMPPAVVDHNAGNLQSILAMTILNAAHRHPGYSAPPQLSSTPNAVVDNEGIVADSTRAEQQSRSRCVLRNGIV